MKECTLHLIKYHKSDREEVSTGPQKCPPSLPWRSALASFAALIQVTHAYRLITVATLVLLLHCMFCIH